MLGEAAASEPCEAVAVSAVLGIAAEVSIGTAEVGERGTERGEARGSARLQGTVRVNEEPVPLSDCKVMEPFMSFASFLHISKASKTQL